MITSKFAFVVLGFFLYERELWKAKNVLRNKISGKIITPCCVIAHGASKLAATLCLEIRLLCCLLMILQFRKHCLKDNGDSE